MATITLEHGEVASIPWTIAADITGKTVIFTVARNTAGARVLRKTSASGITVTQATPTGIGTIAIAEADFGSGKLEAGSYVYALWYENADSSNPVHVATGQLDVTGTVARTA